MTAERGTRAVETVAVTAFVAALLLPRGDAPFPSFWREWLAAIALLLWALAGLSAIREAGARVRLAPGAIAWPAFAVGALALLQFAVGVVPWWQDAWIPAAYAATFGAMALVSESLPIDVRHRWLDRLALAFWCAGMVGAPLAVAQWLGRARLELGVPVLGGRPIGTMEQANLFATVLMQGLLGAWRLLLRQAPAGRWRALRRGALLASVPWLLGPLVLTQSRVTWLVAGAVVLAMGVVHARQAARARLAGPPGQWKLVMAVLLLFVVGTLALPSLDGALHLTGMSLGDRLAGGRRVDLYAAMLDAVGRRPWTGWGAQQVPVAQWAVAPDHPPLMYVFSSAHDIALDLMLWFGVPAAAIVLAWVAAVVVHRFRQAADTAGLVSVLAACALLLHALVEQPLAYLFLLAPLAMLLGASATQPATPPATDEVAATRSAAARRISLAVLAIGPALLLAVIAQHYLAEQPHRAYTEFDLATHHLMLAADEDQPDDPWLDQLVAFQRFAAHDPSRPVTAAQLATWHRAVMRTPYGPAIERYAYLAATNGQPALAVDSLRRAPTVAPPDYTRSAARAWAMRRAREPVLPPYPWVAPAVPASAPIVAPAASR